MSWCAGVEVRLETFRNSVFSSVDMASHPSGAVHGQLTCTCVCYLEHVTHLQLMICPSARILLPRTLRGSGSVASKHLDSARCVGRECMRVAAAKRSLITRIARPHPSNKQRTVQSMNFLAQVLDNRRCWKAVRGVWDLVSFAGMMCVQTGRQAQSCCSCCCS